MPVDLFRHRDLMNRTMELNEAFIRVYDYVVANDPEVVGPQEIGVHTQICRELAKYGTSEDVAGCMARGFRFGRLYILAGVVSQLALARSDREDVGMISIGEYFNAKCEATRLMKRYKESPMLLFEEGAQELFVRIQQEAAETSYRYRAQEGRFFGR